MDKTKFTLGKLSFQVFFLQPTVRVSQRGVTWSAAGADHCLFIVNHVIGGIVTS
jgi:hypothetical protein